jgi:competence protein ComEA
MNRFRKIADYLFGYNRREKRATLFLVVILLVLFAVRYINLPREHPMIVVTISDEKPMTDTAAEAKNISPHLFAFDPNRVSKEDLLKLGLSSRQASTLISYRNTGARFRTVKDLSKVYGIDTGLLNRLSPYVIINDKKILSESSSHEDSAVSRRRAESVDELCLLELNSCTAKDLLKLPGIGEILSGRIIRYRDLLGGFVSTDQLGEVYGIDPLVFGDIMGMVYVNSDSVRKICIDTCSYKTLARHPYIGSVTARSILKYRELIGAPDDINELVHQKVIDTLKARRMAPYCTFSSGNTAGPKH